MRAMSSSDNSQFFLPRFLRSGLNHAVASISCTLPRRCAGLAVGQHPDIGGDAGVVEHVQRQGDDGFEPVVLDDPAADIALALPASPVNSEEPLCTSAMRLPSCVLCFILDSMFARNSICPSLERVTRLYSASPHARSQSADRACRPCRPCAPGRSSSFCRRACVDGPLDARGLRQKNSDPVRLRSCVRPVCAASRPLAQMGSAIHSQTEERP